MLTFDVNKSIDLVQLSKDGLVERYQDAIIIPHAFSGALACIRNKYKQFIDKQSKLFLVFDYNQKIAAIDSVEGGCISQPHYL